MEKNNETRCNVDWMEKLNNRSVLPGVEGGQCLTAYHIEWSGTQAGDSQAATHGCLR